VEKVVRPENRASAKTVVRLKTPFAVHRLSSALYPSVHRVTKSAVVTDHPSSFWRAARGSSDTALPRIFLRTASPTALPPYLDFRRVISTFIFQSQKLAGGAYVRQKMRSRREALTGLHDIETSWPIKPDQCGSGRHVVHKDKPDAVLKERCFLTCQSCPLPAPWR